MKKVLLLLAIWSGNCSAQGLNLDPWTKEDSYRQAAVTALLIYDWSQTRYMAKNPCPASNPNCDVHFGEGGMAQSFIGSHPSVGRVNNYFAASILAHAVISYALPSTWRQGWQYVWIGIEADTVRHNYIGIKHGF